MKLGATGSTEEAMDQSLNSRCLRGIMSLICFALVLSTSAYAQQDEFHAGGLAPPDSPNRPPSPGASGAPQTNATYQQGAGSYSPQGSYSAATSDTEKRLDESEQHDSGRGLEWLYLNVEGGIQSVGLETFSSDKMTYGKITSSSAVGPTVSAGVGVRLLVLTLGARAKLGFFKDWNLGTVGGEVGLHFPIGSLEPYFNAGGGYAALASLDGSTWGGDTSIRGGYARLGFGLDYYLTPSFSLGGLVTGEVLFVSRAGLKSLSDAGNMSPDAQNVARKDGSSVGGAINGSLVLGLHF